MNLIHVFTLCGQHLQLSDLVNVLAYVLQNVRHDTFMQEALQTLKGHPSHMLPVDVPMVRISPAI